MYFICKRPLFWTRPRGPRLAYNITECIGYVKHAPFIKMCNEQTPQFILVIPNGQTRLQYKTDQYVLISSKPVLDWEKEKKIHPWNFKSTRVRTQWWRGSGPPGLSLMDSLKPLSISFSILAFNTSSASRIIRPRLLPSAFANRCCNGRDADDRDNETQIKNKHIKNFKLAICSVLINNSICKVFICFM